MRHRDFAIAAAADARRRLTIGERPIFRRLRVFGDGPAGAGRATAGIERGRRALPFERSDDHAVRPRGRAADLAALRQSSFDGALRRRIIVTVANRNAVSDDVPGGADSQGACGAARVRRQQRRRQCQSEKRRSDLVHECPLAKLPANRRMLQSADISA